MSTQEHLDCLIEPNQTIDLGTSVPGIVDQVLVQRADVIHAGQPLVRLESSVEQATTKQAEERAAMDGTIRARRADMVLARQNMKRMEKLFERDVVSSQKRDEARAEYEVARRNYQVAKENQRLAQLEFETFNAKLARRVIRSPIDGVVVERMSMPGEFVDERPLLTLAQLDPLRVEVLIPAELFGSIAPGMQAEIDPEVPTGGPLRADVVTVDRLVDSASGTFRVSLALPNPNQRIPGGLKCGVRFLEQIANQPEEAPTQRPQDGAPESDDILTAGEIPGTATTGTVAVLQTDLPLPSAEIASDPGNTAVVPVLPGETLPGSRTEAMHTADERLPEEKPIATVATSQEVKTASEPGTTTAIAETIAPRLPSDNPGIPLAPEPLPLPPVETVSLVQTTTQPQEPVPAKIVAKVSPADANELNEIPAANPGATLAKTKTEQPANVEPARLLMAKQTPWCGTLSASSPYVEQSVTPLQQAGIDVARTHTGSEKPRDYIVEMPAGEGSCNRKVRSMNAAGFPDVACYKLKSSGRMMISGGLFKHEKYAIVRQQEFQAKGFDMQLRARYTKSHQQTLQLTADSRLQVLSILAGLGKAEQLELNKAPCHIDRIAHR